MKFTYECIIYIKIDLSFHFGEIWIYFEVIPFFFWGFLENEKNIVLVLILALLSTLYCILWQFGTQK